MIVPIEQLKRTEAGGGVLSLDTTAAELRMLPTHHDVGNCWKPIL